VPSGLRLVSAEEVRTKPRKSRKIGLWSRKYRWVERAAAWDRIVDQRLREKQLDEIERMAKRQAQEAQVLSQVLMAPVVAFATGLSILQIVIAGKNQIERVRDAFTYALLLCTSMSRTLNRCSYTSGYTKPSPANSSCSPAWANENSVVMASSPRHERR